MVRLVARALMRSCRRCTQRYVPARPAGWGGAARGAQYHFALSTTFTKSRPSIRRRAFSRMISKRRSGMLAASATATWGRDQHVFHAPQRVPGGQRLGLEDVQPGPGDLPGLKGGYEIVELWSSCPGPMLMK